MKKPIFFSCILCSFLPIEAYSALPVYPAEIVGRDLYLPGLNWVGHIGITTAPTLEEDASEVIEVLNTSPAIQQNPLHSFQKTVTSYWGSRYGIADRAEHALKILREAHFQKDLGCATYTATPHYSVGKGAYDNAGQAIATQCAYFRCDTFISYIFHQGGYKLPTYHAPGINISVATLPKLVFEAFPHGNEDGPRAMKSMSAQYLSALPLDDFIIFVDSSLQAEKAVFTLLELTKNDALSLEKQVYLFDTIGFIGDVTILSDLIELYHIKTSPQVQKQLLATIQNIRQRSTGAENAPLHPFYLELLHHPPSEEKIEMVLRGFLAVSSNDEITANIESIYRILNTAAINQSTLLNLNIELIHQCPTLEKALIPDIINLLLTENNGELDEIFHVYLINRLVHTGMNEMEKSSKQQISDYLSAIHFKYEHNHVKSIDEHLSLLSYGAWLEASALINSDSIEDTGKYIAHFLKSKQLTEQKKYVSGLSSHAYLKKAFSIEPELVAFKQSNQIFYISTVGHPQ